MHHIHSLGIIHRDIKLENVLIAPDGRAFLADFGLAICTDDFETLKRARFLWWAGSAHYMAPEVLALKKFPRETRGHSYNYKCDIWSLGIAMRDLYAPFLPTEEWIPDPENPENPFRLIQNVRTFLSSRRLPLTVVRRCFTTSLLRDQTQRSLCCIPISHTLDGIN